LTEVGKQIFLGSFRNRKSTTIFRVLVRKSIIFLSPQICGFVILGTYLRTAHLCNSMNAFYSFYVSPSLQVVSQLGSAGANAQSGKKTGARETIPVDPVTLP
jgi:hypothetical protein